jgi:hypothetical protein
MKKISLNFLLALSPWYARRRIKNLEREATLWVGDKDLSVAALGT